MHIAQYEYWDGFVDRYLHFDMRRPEKLKSTKAPLNAFLRLIETHSAACRAAMSSTSANLAVPGWRVWPNRMGPGRECGTADLGILKMPKDKMYNFSPYPYRLKVIGLIERLARALAR
jgi:hypothetical protein